MKIRIRKCLAKSGRNSQSFCDLGKPLCCSSSQSQGFGKHAKKKGLGETGTGCPRRLQPATYLFGSAVLRANPAQ